MNQPKIILITGTTSGFGLLTAARLASKGHKVIATIRDFAKIPALISEVHKRDGEVDIFELDVTKKETIEDCMERTAAKHGHIDVLVNNAGYGIGGFFEDLTEEEIRKQFETNFFGVQNVTRAALKLMRPRRGGKIINISSVAGFYASPAFGAYNASKWALEGFSESLRYELKLFGIDVILIEPGTYRTQIFHANARYAKDFDNPESPYFDYSQHLRKKVINYVENDCHKDPEEVARLIEKVIDAPNPSFRNIPDIEGKTLYFLRRILPFNAFSWIISRVFLSKRENERLHPTLKEENIFTEK